MSVVVEVRDKDGNRLSIRTDHVSAIQQTSNESHIEVYLANGLRWELGGTYDESFEAFFGDLVAKRETGE